VLERGLLEAALAAAPAESEAGEQQQLPAEGLLRIVVWVLFMHHSGDVYVVFHQREREREKQASIDPRSPLLSTGSTLPRSVRTVFLEPRRCFGELSSVKPTMLFNRSTTVRRVSTTVAAAAGSFFGEKEAEAYYVHRTRCLRFKPPLRCV
jgi:hypothetical protein